MNAIQLHLPPLRDRREDLPVPASYFLDRARDKSGNEYSLAEEARGCFPNTTGPATFGNLKARSSGRLLCPEAP
jgi:transcriptional regulator with GAF, ATPase, and Fis domain